MNAQYDTADIASMSNQITNLRAVLQEITDFFDHVIHDEIIVGQGLSFEGAEATLARARAALRGAS